MTHSLYVVIMCKSVFKTEVIVIHFNNYKYVTHSEVSHFIMSN